MPMSIDKLKIISRRWAHSCPTTLKGTGKLMTPESTAKAKIKKWLNDNGWYVRAIGSNQYTRSGNPDYYAVKDGKVLFLEVKSATGKMSKEQIETSDEISSRGGHYVVARGISDVDNYLNYLKDYNADNI